MPKVKLTSPGPWGEKSARDYGYSMVLEVDGRVELSGQGGWNPATLDFPGPSVAIEDEIAQAFDNVGYMLRETGLDWTHVAHVNSYHTVEADGTILRATAEMARQFRLCNRPPSPSRPVLAPPLWATRQCGLKSG